MQKVGVKQALKEIFEVKGRKATYTGKMCEDYLMSRNIIYWSALIVPCILEITNFFLREVSKLAAKFIKFENKTQQEGAILLLHYFLTFFNSSILILMINANFYGTGIPLEFIDGFYADFNGKWYTHVAPIFITPMIIRCLVLPIVSIFKISMKKLLILYDKRGKLFPKIYGEPPVNSGDDHTGVYTMQKLNLQFANIHSGKDFELSDPYPKVLTAVMICMMFGLGLPILFPLTLVYLVVIYFTFKIMAVYWFRRPPLFDDTLSKIFMYNIKYSALLF